MQWIPGSEKLADGLTKRNYKMFRQINNIATTGTLPQTIFTKATQKISNGEVYSRCPYTSTTAHMYACEVK